MTDGEDTAGHDPKVSIQQKPTKDTGRDQGWIKSTNLWMEMDDLRNNYPTNKLETWRSEWEVLLMVATGRSTRILLSTVVQERIKRFNQLASLPDTIRNMPMGGQITWWSSNGQVGKNEGKNGLACGRQRGSVMGALNKNERRPRTYPPGSGSMNLCGSSGMSGESMTHLSRHTNHVQTKYKRRMVQQIVQMACRRNATGAPEHRNLEKYGSLMQWITAHKRSHFMGKLNSQWGTESMTTRILLSDVV